MEHMRAVLIVIDGFGIGELPDASLYNDVGANTYAAIAGAVQLPNLHRLGLDNIFGVNQGANSAPLADYGRMRRISAGSNPRLGHHELAGIITYEYARDFPDVFPAGVIFDLENAFGKEVIGNCGAKNPEILKSYGNEHCKSGKPIVFSGKGRILQIAAHESVIAPVKLYRMCEEARRIMLGEYEPELVVARPFTGESENYRYTSNRKEFWIKPRSQSILSRLTVAGITTVCLGRINEYFAGIGVGVNMPAHNDYETGERLLEAINKYDNALIYADFHDADDNCLENDVEGFISALEKADGYIGKATDLLSKEDLLIVTSTHGCAIGKSTDYTREYVPLLLYGKSLISGHDYGTIHGYDRVALTLSDYFSDFESEKSLLAPLRRIERLQQEIKSRLPAALKKKRD